MVNRQLSLIAGAAHGIYRAASDGRFIDANPALAEMLGYSSVEDLLAEGSTATIYESPSARQRLLEECARSGRVTGVEVEWKRKDRTSIRVRLSGRIVSAEAGESPDCEVIVEDVTEQRLRDEQLCQLRKLAIVGQLSAGVAHNFNNLLTSILGFTEILLARQGPAESDRPLKEIDRAARRGAALTRQLLAFASASPLGTWEVDASHAIGPVCDLMASLVRGNIKVLFEASSAPATVRLELNQIEQAIVHLVLNAQDALPDGGEIRIDVSKTDAVPASAMPPRDSATGPWVRVRVADNGIGMAPEVRKHLFEPFFTTKQPEGVGLGLSAVYGIARHSGGCVAVQTEIGRGTTVDLYFPASQVRSGVLIVDDDPVVCEIAARMLRTRGFTVIVAASASEAVERFERNIDGIGVLVTDVHLSGTSGLELSRRLTSQRQDLALVFISGGVSPKEPGTDLRRAAFLGKPFDASGLISAIEHARAARLSKG